MENKIKEWLLARNISEKVIFESNIKWNGYKIEFPVYDITGKLLFKKYRRDPYIQNTSEPKYTYDRGAVSSLYNIQKELNSGPIFITEGEADALVLNSFKVNAVSSTGGAGTFKEEWATWLNEKPNDVYICYDRDMAGARGAIKVQQMIPKAKIVFLPYTLKGKDITDFFIQYKMVDFIKLVNGSESWLILPDTEEIPSKKVEINEIIKKFKEEILSLENKKSILNNQDKFSDHIDVMVEIYEKRIKAWKSIKDVKGKQKIDGSDVSRAKSVPITNFLKFNGAGFAKCIFHNDDTPSLKYYKKDNIVHCFACQAHEDVIGVYMKLNGVNFKEAVDKLKN